MSITKVSDQEVALFCFAQSDEAAVKISIPRVAVAGLPHDATFDSTVNDAAVALDEQEFMSVRSTVKGRIKEVETRRSSDRGNDPDPATPAYECDISIRCEMEGGVLNFKVLSVEPDRVRQYGIRVTPTFINLYDDSTDRRNPIVLKTTGGAGFFGAPLAIPLSPYSSGLRSVSSSSSSCDWSIYPGASSITSRPALFFGNAM